jgi:isoleucyl-tRNA synthetase
LVVGITTEITPELRDRGIARELVRAIGELRKKAGCKVSDRVMIGYTTSDETAAAAIASLGESIQRETLSQLQPARLLSSDAQSVCELDDSTIELTLQR